jgi:hypothetical protein
MLMSPLLLFLLNRTESKNYGYIVIMGFLLALYSFCSLFFESEPLHRPTPLFIFGYCVYVSSFGVLTYGFMKQIHN